MNYTPTDIIFLKPILVGRYYRASFVIVKFYVISHIGRYSKDQISADNIAEPIYR